MSKSVHDFCQVYNSFDNYPATNDAAHAFIVDVQKQIASGYGFVPFTGAGLSAPSGIPLVWEMESYLQRCIAMALGVLKYANVPWNPRTHQWPPFDGGESDIAGTWEGSLEVALKRRIKNDPWNPDNRVFQEALGATAEWRTALQFLSRIVYEGGRGNGQHSTYVLDAPRQDVIDSALREIMRGKRPTLGHRMLAALGGLLRLDILVSTNFDDFLEQAFLAAKNPVTVFGLQMKSELPPYPALAPQRSLVKLHGDRHSLRADYTLDAIPDYADCERFVEYLLSADGHKAFSTRNESIYAGQERLPSGNHLLMMGFSAREKRTRTLIQHAWKHLDDAFTVYWICYTPKDVERVISFTTDVFKHLGLNHRTAAPKRSRILRHTNLGLLFLQLFQTIRCSVPTTGILFPTASRLAIPPIFSQNSTKRRAHDEIRRRLATDIADRLAEFRSDVHGPQLLVVTSKPQVMGVTSVCSEVFDRAQAEGDYCVWLEMNDITCTDDLFEQLLDATNYRKGSESWMPVFVAGDADSRADEIRRLVKATNAPWVFFLNARERPGSNLEEMEELGEAHDRDVQPPCSPGTGIEAAPVTQDIGKSDVGAAHEASPNGFLDGGSDTSDAEQDAFVEFINTLCQRGAKESSVTVVLMTNAARDHKQKGINDKIQRTPLLQDCILTLPRDCVPYNTRSIPEKCIEWTASGITRQSGSSREQQTSAGDQDKVADRPKPENSPIHRRRFLLALILMQRTRFVSSLVSDAFAVPRELLQRDDMPNKVTLETALEWIGGTGGLEEIGLIRRKLGGFIWLRADSRNTLRSHLKSQASLKVLLKSLSHSITEHLDDWQPELDFPDIHWQLALWYRRVMTASDSPGALFEAVHHACMSVRATIINCNSRRTASVCELIEAVNRLNWATALLQAHGFMVQTRGYSRGSCRRLDNVRGRLSRSILRQVDKLRHLLEGEAFKEPIELLDTAVLRLRLRSTELMRAIAREVGEGVKAYLRHRWIRDLLAGEECSEEEDTAGKANSARLFSHFFESADTKSIPVNERPSEWLRYWRWCGMLGIGARSYEKARTSLATVISSIILGVSSRTACQPRPGYHTIKEASRGMNSDLNVAITRFAEGMQQASELIGTGALLPTNRCKFFDIPITNAQPLRLELLRSSEQVVDCLLRELMVSRRISKTNPKKQEKKIEEAQWRGLDAIIRCGLRLCETILSEEHSAESSYVHSAMWCHSRLLLHSSICAIRMRREWTQAMKLLTDAEASASLVDAKRYGSDRALVELHRAEVRIEEALQERVSVKGKSGEDGPFFQDFIKNQAFKFRPDDELKVREAWQVRGVRLRQQNWDGKDGTVRASFRKVKALIRDAIRFIDRADVILSQRRRNVFWTTWYYHRRLQAVSLLLWATVFEEETPIPYLGHEAAPAGFNTIADEILESTQRIVRVDAYRFATIVESYASCMKALHFRLLLDPRAERIKSRQTEMRDKLEKAAKELAAMLARRNNVDIAIKRFPGIAADPRSKVNKDYIICSTSVRMYVKEVLKDVNMMLETLKHPLS